MRLVIDSQIPFMKGHAEQLGEVIYKPGQKSMLPPSGRLTH